MEPSREVTPWHSDKSGTQTNCSRSNVWRKAVASLISSDKNYLLRLGKSDDTAFYCSVSLLREFTVLPTEAILQLRFVIWRQGRCWESYDSVYVNKTQMKVNSLNKHTASEYDRLSNTSYTWLNTASNLIRIWKRRVVSVRNLAKPYENTKKVEYNSIYS